MQITFWTLPALVVVRHDPIKYAAPRTLERGLHSVITLSSTRTRASGMTV